MTQSNVSIPSPFSEFNPIVTGESFYLLKIIFAFVGSQKHEKGSTQNRTSINEQQKRILMVGKLKI